MNKFGLSFKSDQTVPVTVHLHLWLVLFNKLGAILWGSATPDSSCDRHTFFFLLLAAGAFLCVRDSRQPQTFISDIKKTPKRNLCFLSLKIILLQNNIKIVQRLQYFLFRKPSLCFSWMQVIQVTSIFTAIITKLTIFQLTIEGFRSHCVTERIHSPILAGWLLCIVLRNKNKTS